MQTLGMLAGFDLRAMGHNSARYIHVIAEALKLAFADRERYYGDSPDVPLAELLSPAYCRERVKLIRQDKAMHEAPPPGDLANVAGTARRSEWGRPGPGPSRSQSECLPFERTSAAAPDPAAPTPSGAGGTTHIAAIDAPG